MVVKEDGQEFRMSLRLNNSIDFNMPQEGGNEIYGLRLCIS